MEGIGRYMLAATVLLNGCKKPEVPVDTSVGSQVETVNLDPVTNTRLVVEGSSTGVILGQEDTGVLDRDLGVSAVNPAEEDVIEMIAERTVSVPIDYVLSEPLFESEGSDSVGQDLIARFGITDYCGGRDLNIDLINSDLAVTYCTDEDVRITYNDPFFILNMDGGGSSPMSGVKIAEVIEPDDTQPVRVFSSESLTGQAVDDRNVGITEASCVGAWLREETFQEYCDVFDRTCVINPETCFDIEQRLIECMDCRNNEECEYVIVRLTFPMETNRDTPDDVLVHGSFENVLLLAPLTSGLVVASSTIDIQLGQPTDLAGAMIMADDFMSTIYAHTPVSQ